MITSLSLINFKSFSEQTILFAPLTVLLGGNGASKSSIIQSLLLLKQSEEAGVFEDDGLRINGELCSLGVGRDILRQSANDETIVFVLEEEDRKYQYRFKYIADADILPVIPPCDTFSQFLMADLIYLTAERIGPRLTSPRSITSATERKLGINGEGALAVLERYRAHILDPDDPRRRGQSGSLEEIFQSYLSDVSLNARIELKPYGDVDSIGSAYTFSKAGAIPGDPFRPTNVGFGLSYALPIIVACLVALPGSTLIIENPEAHLHTKGQRAICNLLTLTALAGVQVVIETHSREIFYWLRNNARSGAIPAEIGCINYIEGRYTSEGDRISHCHNLPELTSPLGDWPADFYEAFGSAGDLIAAV